MDDVKTKTRKRTEGAQVGLASRGGPRRGSRRPGGPSDPASAEGPLTELEALDLLLGAGVPEDQAKAQVSLFHYGVHERLADKKDIEMVKKDIETSKGELKRDIAATNERIENLRKELKKDIEVAKSELKTDLANRTLYSAIATVAVLGTLVTFLEFRRPDAQAAPAATRVETAVAPVGPAPTESTPPPAAPAP